MSKQNQRSQHNTPEQNKKRQQDFQKSESKESNYDNTDSGALFKNNRKNEEKQPDLTGSMNIGGVDYWLSAWPKVSKSGEKYLSLALTDKENDENKYSGKLETHKKGNDKHPDMVGALKIEGEEINIAGWFHADKKNKKEKYISLMVSENSFDQPTTEMPWDF